MRILTRKEFQDDMAKEWSKAVEAEYKAQIEEAVLAEREACAKVCEDMSNTEANMNKTWRNGCRDVAEVIRARGQA